MMKMIAMTMRYGKSMAIPMINNADIVTRYPDVDPRDFCKVWLSDFEWDKKSRTLSTTTTKMSEAYINFLDKESLLNPPLRIIIKSDVTGEWYGFEYSLYESHGYHILTAIDKDSPIIEVEVTEK